MAVIEDIIRPTQTAAPKRRFSHKFLISCAAVFALLALLTIFFVQQLRSDSPVPAEIRGAVNFKVYYPEQSKLPADYRLDTTSFRLAQSGVVVYSVRKGSQQLVFSEEQTPGGDVVDKFISSYIPLHNPITTDIGKAAMGAAGQGANLQTIVSLPISQGPWLIITAPAGTKQSDMQQVLESLTK